MKKTSDIIKLSETAWRVLGDNLVTRIVRRVRVLMQNYKGQAFASLSEQYKKYKMNDMRKFGRGKNKVGAGNRLQSVGSESLSSKKGKADMTLTGKMMDNLAVRKSSAVSVTIGWDGTQSVKVSGLDETKNYQIIGSGTTVLHKDEEKYIKDYLETEFEKNIAKWEKETIKINLGK